MKNCEDCGRDSVSFGVWALKPWDRFVCLAFFTLVTCTSVVEPEKTKEGEMKTSSDFTFIKPDNLFSRSF
jgi:hypothetical protein